MKFCLQNSRFLMLLSKFQIYFQTWKSKVQNSKFCRYHLNTVISKSYASILSLMPWCCPIVTSLWRHHWNWPIRCRCSLESHSTNRIIPVFFDICITNYLMITINGVLGIEVLKRNIHMVINKSLVFQYIKKKICHDHYQF